MEATTAERLVLRPTDEIEALPEYATVSELISDDVDRGRCEVLPESHLPGSAWHPGTVGARGGPYSPPWWSDDPIIDSRAVHLFRLRDVYYLPKFGVVISAAGEVMKTSMAEAAYRTPDLSLLPHAERTNDETVVNVPRDHDALHRVIVSMPWGALWNYGHFLLDCLPTVASVAEMPELEGYEFAFPALQPWHRRHLELLGAHDLIELEASIYRVSDVIFANSMAHNLQRPNINYRTIPARQLTRKKSTPLSFDKVYLSRRGNPKRIFLSEAQLEDRLEELGFTIIAPERHTIDEQIDVFRNADVIVGCAGAAFANVLYCRKTATVVEITPASMVTPNPIGGIWVRNICAIVGCNWRPYFCDDIPPEDPTLIEGVKRVELDLSFDLDIEDLVRYIEQLAPPI